MTNQPFPFDACKDLPACRAGMAPLIAPGMTWSEVHCGRCGKTGIVVHADHVPVPAPEPAPEVEAPSEPETESVAEAEAPRASGKGSGR
ncbi:MULTISPECIES: hypothetical protein [Methylobacteriaceae]|uniref:hypothetical protein n=1 Tax=Methylobacteriaceae TaxID=119045 RepID=UPI000CDAE2DA|nr:MULTISPECIES: hypothetical protein [Methylobacteriaceae]MCP1549431.1 hypothetical protein [Methylorubrum zatmanii]MCP1553956.1 hypothetical protein [Methylorubrum extorquens]MCP1579733.1 hypothetical protein [Methylorubrum extorquens]POR41009.1 hypothetical protein CRT23_21195 [Methylobacterium sp. V23]